MAEAVASPKGSTTRVDEIAPDVFRISTHDPSVIPPGGFTFNQFLIRDEQPFLFHTGMSAIYPAVSRAIEEVVPLESLRWISFAHVEADECGALTQLFADAPRAQVVHGGLVCGYVGNFSTRPTRKVANGEVLDLGRRRLRFIATPHVPHNWESALWFEETTRLLLVGDLLATLGSCEPTSTRSLVDDAVWSEQQFQAMSLGPDFDPTVRELAALDPAVLATMHGPSFVGDASSELLAFAEAIGQGVRGAV